MGLQEMGLEGADWIHLTEDRDHGNELLGTIKCWEFVE
jgi:hypothetical protein